MECNDERKLKNSNTAEQCEITTINGQDMGFQTAFEGDKTIVTSNVYGNNI